MDNLQFGYRNGKSILIRKLISYLLHLFLLISCYQQSVAETTYQRKCSSGLSAIGWTYPESDINIELGNPLEIFCSLNLSMTQGNDASNIVFDCNGTVVSSQYVTVLNKTTSFLRIPAANASQCLYYCKLITNSNVKYSISSSRSSNSSEVYETDEKLVCVNKVVVGSRPAPAENINCVSYNLEKLVCNWTAPYNPIKTEYSASYKVNENKDTYRCPKEINRGYANNCTWTSESSPSYRFSFKYLYVTVVGANVIGNSSVSYRFPNYARMIPAPPSELTVSNKTASSVCLSWNIGIAPSVIKETLICKIEYIWPELNYWKLKYHNCSGEQITHHYNITGLPYPNMLYDFRVYLRSGAETNESAAFWSEPAKLVVKTEPCAPYYPPKTESGTFEVHLVSDNKRDIYVYWQSLLPKETNGDEFRYEVTGNALNAAEERQRQQLQQQVDNDASEDVKPITTANAYAKFAELSWNSYRFRITSVNKEGVSPTSSEVIVPAGKDVLEEPALFINTESGAGVYELSWKHSPNWRDVTNFTVFWCESERDQPNKCKGRLNWTSLSADANRFNISTPGEPITYQFAISANSVRSSSGMIWAVCTVRRGKIGKIKNVWITKIGPDFVEVGWKLECPERIYNVKGFQLFYSAIGEPERNITVLGDSSLVSGNVTGLKPFTRYKIAVAIFTEDSIGPRSNELINCTRETRPDTSNSFVSEEVTNTTIRLKWDPPIAMNGVFKHYEVYYNSDREIITNTGDITLKNLKPYTDYVVRILACTTLCSELVNRTIRTGIGIPGIIEDFNLSKLNSSVVVAVWKAPLEPAGPFVNYHVIVRGKVTEIYETNATTLQITIPKCDKGEVYSIVVQSRTVDTAGIEYKGNLSTSYTIPCEEVNSVPLIARFALFTTMLLCIVLIIFLVRGGVRRCRQMKEIQVCLPQNFLTFDSSLTTDRDNVSSNDCWDNRNELDRLNVKLSETDCEDDINNTTIDITRKVDEHFSADLYGSGCYTGRSSTSSSITATVNRPSSPHSGAEMELNAIDHSLTVEYGPKSAVPNNSRSVPARDTSSLMSTSSSDFKWDHSDAVFSYVPTSSDSDDCAWMYTATLNTSDADSTATAPVTAAAAAATPSYVATDHFPSGGDRNNTTVSHQVSNNGYVTVVPKTTPYSAG